MSPTTPRATFVALVLSVGVGHGACRPGAPRAAGDTGAHRGDVDAPADAGGGDAEAAAVELAGLLVEPGSVTLAPTTAMCLELRLLHEDGSQSAVDAGRQQVTITANDPAVAVPTEPEDCPGIGVIGLASGRSTLRISVVENDQVIAERLIPVLVEPFVVEVKLRSSLVLVNTEAPLPEPRIEFRDERSQLHALPAVFILPRWLDLETEDSNIAVVQFDPLKQSFTVHGKAPGVTLLVGSYGPMDDPTALVPANITVPREGALIQVMGLQLRLDDGAVRNLRAFWEVGSVGVNAPSEALPPGTCGHVLAEGWFEDADGNSWLQPLADPEMEYNPALRPAGGGRFCVAEGTEPGDAWVHACREGLCARAYFAVRGALDDVDLLLTPPAQPVAPTAGAAALYCPELGLEMLDASGNRRDVTNSPSAYWWGGAGESALARVRDGWGAVRDQEGGPCFELQPAPSSEVTIELLVDYAGFQRQSTLRVLAP